MFEPEFGQTAMIGSTRLIARVALPILGFLQSHSPAAAQHDLGKGGDLPPDTPPYKHSFLLLDLLSRRNTAPCVWNTVWELWPGPAPKKPFIFYPFTCNHDNLRVTLPLSLFVFPAGLQGGRGPGAVQVGEDRQGPPGA